MKGVITTIARNAGTIFIGVVFVLFLLIAISAGPPDAQPTAPSDPVVVELERQTKQLKRIADELEKWNEAEKRH